MKITFAESAKADIAAFVIDEDGRLPAGAAALDKASGGLLTEALEGGRSVPNPAGRRRRPFGVKPQNDVRRNGPPASQTLGRLDLRLPSRLGPDFGIGERDRQALAR